jgi:hypothetical protein
VKLRRPSSSAFQEVSELWICLSYLQHDPSFCLHDISRKKLPSGTAEVLKIIEIYLYTCGLLSTSISNDILILATSFIIPIPLMPKILKKSKVLRGCALAATTILLPPLALYFGGASRLVIVMHAVLWLFCPIKGIVFAAGSWWSGWSSG